MKQRIAICLLLLTIVYGCTKECPDTYGAHDASVFATFYSVPDSQYLYTELPPNSLFNKDSFSVTDQNGLPVDVGIQTKDDPARPITLFYTFSINIFNSATDSAAFDHEISRQFFIRHSDAEKDTITCTFKAGMGRCNSYLEYLKVYNKGKLIASSNNAFCDITINRQ